MNTTHHQRLRAIDKSIFRFDLELCRERHSSPAWLHAIQVFRRASKSCPFSIVAPKALEAVSVSTSEINVTVVPNELSRVQYFNVSFGGGGSGALCTFFAGTDNFTCPFGSLRAGTHYPFQATACVTQGPREICSLPRKTNGYTIPEGKVVHQYLIVNS